MGDFDEYVAASQLTPETLAGALIVLDTNVFISLYEFSVEDRREVMESLEAHRESIWLPHQVALEFHRLRLKRAKRAKNRISKLSEFITEQFGVFAARAGQDGLSQFCTELREAETELVSRLDRENEALRVRGGQTSVCRRILELIESRTGTAPSHEWIEAADREAKARYDARMPPGYEDRERKKKDAKPFRHREVTYRPQHGDYYLWKQTLERLTEDDSREALIFVTNESTEDWWLKEGDEIVGPRPELVWEVEKTAGCRLFLFRLDTFVAEVSGQSTIELQKRIFSRAVRNETGSLDAPFDTSEVAMRRATRHARRVRSALTSPTVGVLDELIALAAWDSISNPYSESIDRLREQFLQTNARQRTLWEPDIDAHNLESVTFGSPSPFEVEDASNAGSAPSVEGDRSEIGTRGSDD